MFKHNQAQTIKKKRKVATMMRLTSFKVRSLSIALLTFCAAISCTTYAGGDTNEVWISARTNALGTGLIWGSGAITNPFYGDFNAIMKGLATNTTIHLLPGVHYAPGCVTGGDFLLKAYQKVIGAGVDVTIVRRDASQHPDVAQNLGEFRSAEDGVEISDLTVDASGSSTNHYKNMGVSLSGNYCALRRVKIINCSGNATYLEESFPISFGDSNTKGNIISECEVSSVQGDYCSAVILTGQAIVKNNRVYFPSVTHASAVTYFAYTTAWSKDALFLGNYSQGGSVGFRTDTGTETNLTIMANTFADVVTGIEIRKSSNQGWLVDGVTIKDNTIEINTNVPVYAGNWSYAIVLVNLETTKQPWQRIKITGNTMHYSNNTGIGSQAGTVGVGIYSTISTNFFNVQVLGNTIDRSFVNVLQGVGNWWADNMDLNGVPIQVNNLIAGSAGTVSLNLTDGSVFVTSTTTTNIVLPTATGFSSKEIIVINQKTSGSLTVNPTSGNSILPSSPVTISTNQTARFISDGSITWIKE